MIIRIGQILARGVADRRSIKVENFLNDFIVFGCCYATTQIALQFVCLFVVVNPENPYFDSQSGLELKHLALQGSTSTRAAYLFLGSYHRFITILFLLGFIPHG